MFNVANAGVGRIGFQMSATNGFIIDTAAAERMRIDTSGNLGLGVTPSAWTTYPALQVNKGSLWGPGSSFYISANLYFDGTNRRYIASSYASEYEQASGQHIWFNAPSGTAGNVVTLTQAMTLDASGNLGIGTSSPAYNLEVSKSQDGVTNAAVTNANAGTAAQTRLRLNNGGSNFGTISHTGASFTTSGVFRADGTYVYGNGTGGLTLVTGATQPIYFGIANNEVARFDTSGNLGIGVTPSAWVSYQKGVDFGGAGNYGSLSARGDFVLLGSNCYLDSSGVTWRYKNTAAASYFAQSGGAYVWYTAASGTAGNAITFTQAMTLDGNSNLTVTGTMYSGAIRASTGSAVISVVSSYFLGNTAAAGGFRLGSGFNVSFDGTNWKTGTDGGSNGGAALLCPYGAGSLEFHTVANTGTTGQTISNASMIAKMTLDANGKLGIGVSPTANLQVQKDGFNTSAGWYAIARLINTAGSKGMDIGYNNGNNNATLTAYSSGTASGFEFWRYTGAAWEQSWTMDSSGNLLVGTTTNSGTLTVKGNQYNASSIRVSANGNVTLDVLNASGTEVGYIQVNGAGTGTVYATSSDQRLKENIVDAEDAGSFIDAIQVRQFDWISSGTHEDYGLIAQELMQVRPDAVSHGQTEESMKAVDYPKLVPLLIKEIQSLRVRLNALENK
jgi:hypothetical protein